MALKLSLDLLQRHLHQAIKLDETDDLFESLQKRLPELIAATPFVVKGTVRNDNLGWVSYLHVSGTLTLPSTRSLAPVELPVDLAIEELYVLEEAQPTQEVQDEMDETVIVIEDDQIDLQRAIEDHIILAIPTQIFTPNEAANQTMPAGEGWSVISEDEYADQLDKEKEQPNPEFEKLKGLFGDDQEDDQ
ncbi:DUF177 domain-containing protein [Lapidilactobacillus bayanensis]|uniref:DUF177 domain-containing protein n=1 Tax=Lapidilactobacillus bayanensis TaxID=2485998 RepID=UPI000F771D72|nr:YceD family protein [Lapidilactobacillus bayanensis]